MGFFALSACKSKKVVQAPMIEFRDLDTMVVSSARKDKVKEADDYQLPIYHKSHERKNDLLHTSLDVRFNWEKQHLLGKATLKLKPYFYPVNELVLDAKGFDIHKIEFGDNSNKVEYDYNGVQLFIGFEKTILPGKEYIIKIEYTAKPNELAAGGSVAIAEEKGLYFINPTGADAEKPKQIWTQGQTEANSCWFPTIDKPNERCTQEMFITIEDNFETLSNGLLKSSKKNSDGTKTDHWVMDLPHPPYLFMMAIGEYAVVEDAKWKGKPINYYVEPKYKPYAKEIFSNTIPMMDFFSEKLKMDYPWQKYSQVAVRDFVAGAMENTTSSIFGSFVQKTDRELIDNHNEKIIAHELFHHWFGDLATCESWSNLTLNEGFANYSEYMWLEYKYGKDEADYHMVAELAGYVSQARRSPHPLIHFAYNDKEDMFDAHSYNKGGLVLHMLRNYVGDEAFFTALNVYLKEHQYSTVEVHDLRLAFEEVTGMDLNWFFNQWYLSSGHPKLDIKYDYLLDAKKMIVTIEQTQDPDKHPAIFQLPLAIDLYKNKKATQHSVFMDKRVQSFEFDLPEKPDWVNVDADKTLLCEKTDNKGMDAFIAQYNEGKNLWDRLEAIRFLGRSYKDSRNAHRVFESAIKDPFWAIRAEALETLILKKDDPILSQIEKMAKEDPNSFVRAGAIRLLSNIKDKKYVETAKQVLKEERAYPPISAAMSLLKEKSPGEALKVAEQMKNIDNINMLGSVGEIFAATKNPKYLTFFEENWNKISGYRSISFFAEYSKLLTEAHESRQKNAVEKLEKLSMNQAVDGWRRFGSTKAINSLQLFYLEKSKAAPSEDKKQEWTREAEILGNKIKAIINAETNPRLKRAYLNNL